MSELTIIHKDSNEIIYANYPGEHLIKEVMDLMTKNLSEPYPIYTYRYFLDNWPDLCIMAFDSKSTFIGGIIGSVETTSKNKIKGYIAMIAVKDEFRGMKIAKTIVDLFIQRIKNYYKLTEITLETEIDNHAALSLYESKGFKRVKLNQNYYLNGNSAYKLKMWIPTEDDSKLVAQAKSIKVK